MNPFSLPQTLLLEPSLDFSQIDSILSGLGFQAVHAPITPPLIDGEPEFIVWNWHGDLPSVYYNFNSVVRLRTLDVATVPPLFREEIANALNPLGYEHIQKQFDSEDERERLWGIWAALETEQVDLIPALKKMRSSLSGMLLEELDSAVNKLSDIEMARLQVQVGGRSIAITSLELIEALADPNLLNNLAPTREDCHAAFHPSIAESVWSALKTHKPASAGLIPAPDNAALITAAPAGALRWPNSLSHKFPRGYRTIAGWMEPSRVWLAWKGQHADGTEVGYDGLTFIDDHWVWMPKVFRYVEPLILQPPKIPESLKR